MARVARLASEYEPPSNAIQNTAAATATATRGRRFVI
jgi:hypothetical protein